jgi:hypothetical protein
MPSGNRGERAKSSDLSRRTNPITAGASRGYTTNLHRGHSRERSLVRVTVASPHAPQY